MPQQLNTKTVLVAPLNWGLGHATRCIPIINCLLKKEVEVIIASDGAALDLLKKEFPLLPAFPLPAYDVRYPYNNMTVNILLQLPKIARAIRKEYDAIQNLVATQDIQIIISDNRFGCFSPSTYNVFMTHQLNIMAPFPFAEKIIAWWNKRMLQRFDLCWVPDFEEAPGLAGQLSHPSPIKSVQYIGPLSRMKVLDLEKKYDAIAVLSGPEPQRTRLEKLILEQALQLPYRILLVRGLVEDESALRHEGTVSIVGHLTSSELEVAIAKSAVMIARSGYTTVMDLVALGKRAILVPTPGQTEQEYLGRLFGETGQFVVEAQENLTLKTGLKKVLSQKIKKKQERINDLSTYVNKLLQLGK
ncbi:MAG: hypothetical protein ACI8YQ_001181 [Polaribacter sp.]